MALRVGHEKLTAETGWQPRVSWEEGVLQTIRWYADEPRPLDRPRRLAADRRAAQHAVSSVLVTGGGGFLGSHLVERLEADGHDVVVARSADYDLTSMDDTARMFDDADAELVFHLAAEVGGIGANRANPGRYWFANLTMGANVLEQARLHETPKLVIVGTVCAYPKFAPVPFSEDDLWNGYPEETNAPYGVAKKAVLVGAQAYREQYGLDAIFLLPTNLYGPRDNFDLETSHVIPALIRKMVESEDEVVLWGDGSPTREFLYVDDCVEGLVLAAERYDGADPVNLGAAREISIRELAELVADVTGFEGAHRLGHVEAERPAAAKRRRARAPASSSGSRRRTPLREGIERTVAWYRSAVAGVGTPLASVAAARWGGRTVDRLLERPRAVLGALIGGADRADARPRALGRRTTAGSGSRAATRSG